MKTLGIYFGPKVISIVESEGLKVLNNVNISLQQLLGTGVEEKVPEEIKVAAAIKDKLRVNNIESKAANLVLLGRDLIIRTFYMPVLPAREIYAAVRFEAKKYIPFKLEELVYDFQVFLDKASRKNLVLFVGVKRDSLEKYITIFNQLNIKIASIEYAGFSILRLIKLAKIKEKGIFGVLSIDMNEDDEVNFVVLENGFPLFSRDIILASESLPTAVTQSVKADDSQNQNLEKLKVEIRISLDFYLRKFSTKNISSIVVVAPEDYRYDLEAFVRERGLGVKFIDSRKVFNITNECSLGFFKAYSSNLEKISKNGIKIDLLPTKIKNKSQEQVTGGGTFLMGFRIDMGFILLAIMIISMPFIIVHYRLKPVHLEIASILGTRPQVSTVKSELSLDELNSVDSSYKEKIKVISGVLKKMTFITGQLDSISRLVPEGIWLRDYKFIKGESDLSLTLNGSCYMSDSGKERKAINRFINDLKGNSNFNRHFKEMNILSLDQAKLGKITLTNFVIECRGQ